MLVAWLFMWCQQFGESRKLMTMATNWRTWRAWVRLFDCGHVSELHLSLVIGQVTFESGKQRLTLPMTWTKPRSKKPDMLFVIVILPKDEMIWQLKKKNCEVLFVAHYLAAAIITDLGHFKEHFVSRNQSVTAQYFAFDAVTLLLSEQWERWHNLLCQNLNFL